MTSLLYRPGLVSGGLALGGYHTGLCGRRQPALSPVRPMPAAMPSRM